MHDPSRGFHDIKPLPEFLSQSFPTWQLAVAGLALLLTIYVAYRLYYRLNQGANVALEKPDPIKDALDALSSLRSYRSSYPTKIRPYAEMASSLIRNLLSGTLMVPAKEHTTREIDADLGNCFVNDLRFVPKARADRLRFTVTQSLNTLDILMFAINSREEHAKDSCNLQAIENNIESIIKDAKAIYLTNNSDFDNKGKAIPQSVP